MDSATKRTIEEKRRQLSELLVELAKNEELLANPSEKRKIYQRMESIYKNDYGQKPFRHFYSDFFPKLVEIKNNVELGNIDVLAANLRGLMYGYQAQNLDENGEMIDIEDEIIKLYDHINLDAARLNHFTQTFSKTERSLEKLEEDGKKAKEGIQKAKNAEKNYITILGIFASIVLAFTGGLAFSTSVLENIQDVSPYRLAFVVEALAFVFINVIYILTWFIQKVHDNNAAKYPTFMIALNAILALAVLATAACWWFGVAESVELANQMKLQQMIVNS